MIAGITRQVMRDHAVDPRRVYVAGLACSAARDMPSAFAAMRQGASGPQQSCKGPAADDNRRIALTIVFHADYDHTASPRNGDQLIAQSAAARNPRTAVQRGQAPDGHAYTRTLHTDACGQPMLEQWLIHGGGHAWSGGSAADSYTDPRGPDASHEMLRFFLEHPHGIGAA